MPMDTLQLTTVPDSGLVLTATPAPGNPAVVELAWAITPELRAWLADNRLPDPHIAVSVVRVGAGWETELSDLTQVELDLIDAAAYDAASAARRTETMRKVFPITDRCDQLVFNRPGRYEINATIAWQNEGERILLKKYFTKFHSDSRQFRSKVLTASKRGFLPDSDFTTNLVGEYGLHRLSCEHSAVVEIADDAFAPPLSGFWGRYLAAWGVKPSTTCGRLTAQVLLGAAMPIYLIFHMAFAATTLVLAASVLYDSYNLSAFTKPFTVPWYRVVQPGGHCHWLTRRVVGSDGTESYQLRMVSMVYSCPPVLGLIIYLAAVTTAGAGSFVLLGFTIWAGLMVFCLLLESPRIYRKVSSIIRSAELEPGPNAKRDSRLDALVVGNTAAVDLSFGERLSERYAAFKLRHCRPVRRDSLERMRPLD